MNRSFKRHCHKLLKHILNNSTLRWLFQLIQTIYVYFVIIQDSVLGFSFIFQLCRKRLNNIWAITAYLFVIVVEGYIAFFQHFHPQNHFVITLPFYENQLPLPIPQLFPH